VPGRGVIVYCHGVETEIVPVYWRRLPKNGGPRMREQPLYWRCLHCDGIWPLRVAW
jgi:hypothetical protein